MPDIWLIILGLLTFIFGAFAVVVAFGAPYLPTLSKQVEAALQLVDLKPGQTLIELGSGDGRVMAAAAERGLTVVGYELNPLLVLYSRFRLRKYRGQATVHWGNFWMKKWPHADGIFVFLLDNYMEKLDTKVTQQYSHPVKLVSFAFRIPGKEIVKESQGIALYRYN